jgi:hypothetical protein
VYTGVPIDMRHRTLYSHMQVMGTMRKYINSGIQMILVLEARKSEAAFTILAASLMFEHWQQMNIK